MTGAALAELSHVIYSHAETAGADRRCGVMEERQLNAFANARLDHSIKLAIARDLERLYSSAVTEPASPASFVERLGQALEPRFEEVGKPWNRYP